MHHKPVSSDEIIRHNDPEAIGLQLSSSLASDILARARAALRIDPEATDGLLQQLAVIFDLVNSSGQGAEDPTADSRAGGPVKGGLASWQLRLIEKHIDGHLGQRITLSMLSSLVELSTGHFCRAFKISTGETPHGHILRKRVERAQSLMLNTRDSLSQVACECGLTDQAHLTRLFRKYVGHTPLAWRRTWREVL